MLLKGTVGVLFVCLFIYSGLYLLLSDSLFLCLITVLGNRTQLYLFQPRSLCHTCTQTQTSRRYAEPFNF